MTSCSSWNDRNTSRTWSLSWRQRMKLVSMPGKLQNSLKPAIMAWLIENAFRYLHTCFQPRIYCIICWTECLNQPTHMMEISQRPRSLVLFNSKINLETLSKRKKVPVHALWLLILECGFLHLDRVYQFLFSDSSILQCRDSVCRCSCSI